MAVCQDRATGATAVYAGVVAYAFDGVFVQAVGGGGLTCSQILKATPGGANTRFKGVVSTVDASLAAGDAYVIGFPIEGVEVADLQFGTANAKSFVFRAVVNLPAGIYGLAFTNGAATRSYVTTFSVATGGVDTLVLAVVPGDTSGTWIKDTSGAGLYVRIVLAAGSNYVTATTGAWQAGDYRTTSAQTNAVATLSNVVEVCDLGLYAGTQVPTWEMASYAEDLRACQRYYASVEHTIRAWSSSGSNVHSSVGYWPVAMRTTPGLNLTTGPRANLAGMSYTAIGGTIFWAEMVSAASGDTYALDEKLIGNARL